MRSSLVAAACLHAASAARSPRRAGANTTTRLERAVVTGASSNHFRTLLGFLNNYRKYGSNIPLFVYDLGLAAEEAEVVDRYRWATRRVFDYSRYPAYFNISVAAGEYAWKPVLFKEMLDETADAVVWLDCGNRFNGRRRRSDPLPRLFDSVIGQGFLSDRTVNSTKRWCHRATLAKLGHPDGLDVPMCSGALLGASRADPAYDSVVTPWADCARDRACIAPPGSSRLNHRQDQCTLTVVAHNKGYTCPRGHYSVKYHQDDEKHVPFFPRRQVHHMLPP
mmetsp:Transcript_10875/g.33535  ORF Transcript_10875/g.33535 Transcript_10875/m.33535 type:complete len:279 (-) Transcript_10875:34-870(-)